MGFQQQVTIATKKTESGARQTVTGMASILSDVIKGQAFFCMSVSSGILAC